MTESFRVAVIGAGTAGLLAARELRREGHRVTVFAAVPSLIIELQAKWVAKILSGKVGLPTEEEMSSSVEKLHQHMEETGWPKHNTHKLQQDKFDYEIWLVAQWELPPLEIWREQMLFFMKKISLYYGDDFRDAWNVEKWIKEVESLN